MTKERKDLQQMREMVSHGGWLTRERKKKKKLGVTKGNGFVKYFK
jgi:hypothetical protein